jgi:putative exosortase-associated protein (TIGR04073 family)
MKSLLCSLLLLATATFAFADIQDPPMNDYGFTRKLGRGFSNTFFGITEFSKTVCEIQDREGNDAAFSYGIVKGIGRVAFRFGAGIYELITAPFPIYRESYRPFYKSNVPWIHSGYSEFPPDLGLESKYQYNRFDTAY